MAIGCFGSLSFLSYSLKSISELTCIDIDNSVVVVIQCILFVSKWRRSCGSCKDDDALEPEAR